VQVRTRPDPVSIVASLENAIASVDRGVALRLVQTPDQQLAQFVSTQRFPMTLLALFEAQSLNIVAIGVYGVTVCAVAQRTHEVGVRMALGAEPVDVVMLMLGEGLRLGPVGVAIGITSALALTRVTRNLLYGVSTTNPFTYLVVTAVLFAIALGACYVRARRAARADPIIALTIELFAGGAIW